VMPHAKDITAIATIEAEINPSRPERHNFDIIDRFCR
jgi:hypothetical protein